MISYDEVLFIKSMESDQGEEFARLLSQAVEDTSVTVPYNYRHYGNRHERRKEAALAKRKGKK